MIFIRFCFLFMRWLSLLSLFVYLFFSQFIVKAWVTTSPEQFWVDDFSLVCQDKKLDTFESKWWCWKKNNWVYWEVFIEPFSIVKTVKSDFFVNSDYIAFDSFSLLDHYVINSSWSPPQNIYSPQPTDEYVWIILLLL